VYRFRPQPRDLSEWRVAGERLQDFARQYAGAGTLIRARAFENGKRILIGRRLFTVEDGSDEIRGLVDQAEYDRVLADILR
jgi:amide synthase